MILTKDQIKTMYNSYKWVTALYEDGTRRHIYTTSNNNVATKRGLEAPYKENSLFDYRFGEWVNTENCTEYMITDNLSEVSDDISKALFKYI